MTIKIEVLYNCAVKESAFLGVGWGIRDVRGPYLIKNPAEVQIPDWLLDSKFPTKVSFDFSLSNRSPHEGIEVTCNYNKIITSATVKRNLSSTLSVSNVLQDKNKLSVFKISALQLIITSFASKIVPIYDFLALDKVSLERNLDPKVLY